MERLTKRLNDDVTLNKLQEQCINKLSNYGINSKFNVPKNSNWNIEVENKLGKLEDIEEELGIDLITYFKLKVGVKVYANLLISGELVIDNIFGSGKDTMYHIVPKYSRSGAFVGLNEYGKTFALTEEELEGKYDK